MNVKKPDKGWDERSETVKYTKLYNEVFRLKECTFFVVNPEVKEENNFFSWKSSSK